MGSFREDFLDEASKRGSSKTFSDAMGMPDDEDEEFIRKLIRQYELKSGGLLKFTIQQARKEFESGKYGSLRNDNAVVNKDTNMKYVFELPQSFVDIIERYYPTMFRDKKHFAWFKKKLPALMVRPK